MSDVAAPPLDIGVHSSPANDSNVDDAPSSATNARPSRWSRGSMLFNFRSPAASSRPPSALLSVTRTSYTPRYASRSFLQSVAIQDRSDVVAQVNEIMKKRESVLTETGFSDVFDQKGASAAYSWDAVLERLAAKRNAKAKGKQRVSDDMVGTGKRMPGCPAYHRNGVLARRSINFMMLEELREESEAELAKCIEASELVRCAEGIPGVRGSETLVSKGRAPSKLLEPPTVAEPQSASTIRESRTLVSNNDALSKLCGMPAAPEPQSSSTRSRSRSTLRLGTDTLPSSPAPAETSAPPTQAPGPPEAEPVASPEPQSPASSKVASVWTPGSPRQDSQSSLANTEATDVGCKLDAVSERLQLRRESSLRDSELDQEYVDAHERKWRAEGKDVQGWVMEARRASRVWAEGEINW